MTVKLSERWMAAQDNSGVLLRRGRPSIIYGSARDALVAGDYVPTEGVNVGYTDESRLTNYNAPTNAEVTIPDGTDLSDKIVHGIAKPPATVNLGIYGRNFKFAGPSNPSTLTSNKGLWHSRDPVAGSGTIEFEDFVIDPDVPSPWLNGIYGGVETTARRFVIRHVKDGIDTTQPSSGASGDVNFTAEGGLITDLAYFRPDPEHSPNGSHFDGHQHHSGKAVDVVGVFFHMKVYVLPGSLPIGDGRVTGDYAGSGVVVNELNTHAADSTVKWRKCFFKGGSAHMYIHPGVTPTVEENKFSVETYNNYWIRIYNGASPIPGLDAGGGNNGNVWWDGPNVGVELDATPDRYGGINYMA